MLTRLERQAQPNDHVKTELHEIRDITQSALDNIRTLSQGLHPVILDEAGLESALDWYVPKIARQTGVPIAYEKTGTPFEVESHLAIHIYRVLQEALHNLSRHSGASEAWVRLKYLPESLVVEVEDHGKGFVVGGTNGHGIGLVAMRERAQLLGGDVEFTRPNGGGTLVRLTVPRERLESVDAR
jgi:signal transduction histidine kinase